MKKQITILLLTLLTLLTTTLFAQTTTKIYVVKNSAKFLPSELISKQVRDVNGDVCAGLIILSDLTGLSYDSYNGITKKNSEPGKDFLFLQPSERVVEIYKSGYEPLKIILNEYGIHLKSGTTWQIKVTGDKKLDFIPINIITDPKGATVFIDGKNKGTGTTFQVSQGKHKIKITKQGYGKIEKQITVTTKNILFEYNLKEIDITAVQIKTNPTGAKIVINNADKGSTDKGLFLYPNKYKLKLTKAGYLDINKEIEVTGTGNNIFTYTLTKNSGILNITTTPSDAIIRVNNETKPNGAIELKPGEYTINVSKSGYLPKTETITIELGKSVARNYTLTKNSGILNITATPSDAEVLINKEDYSGKSSIELAPATYKLELNKTGYYGTSEMIDIKLGKTYNKNYTLKQKVGKLQFSIIPLDAEVILRKSGEQAYKWTGMKYLKNIGVGTYTIEAKSSGYKTYKKQLEIKENSTAKIDALMEKGSDIIKKIKGMVYVKGGTFQMGSNDGYSDETPIHTVTVNGFYIGKYEVTFAEYDAFCAATGRSKPNDEGWGRGNRPVINVSWNDAVAYCQWAGGRLPTEAEWEYASRGGIHSASNEYKYSGSNNIDDVAWYDDNSGSTTHEVGTKQPNELGIYDMSGNLYEWCNDWYDNNYYSNSPSNNPKGPSTGTDRVFRGGSWYSSSSFGYCRSASRRRSDPTDSDDDFGFRFVRDK